MEQTEKTEKVEAIVQESTIRHNYIKPYVLVNFGKEIATVLARAYGAQSASDKLTSCQDIMNCSLKDEAKIKFIGDIMTRPRKERMAISRKLFKLLEENDNN